MRSPPVLGTAVAGGRALAVGPGGSLGLSSSSSSAWQPSGPGSGGARKGGGRRPSAPSSSLSDKQYRQMGKKERLLMQGLRRIKGCSKKHMVRALELLGEAEQDGIALTTIHYNAVISILARCRALRETKTIMERMERDGKMFSIVTFNSALHACAKAGDAKYALCLLEMIKERVHLEPDQLTYASAILACAGGGNADTALALMNDMRSLGVPPNAHVYNALANVLFRAGKLHEAESCINDMAQDGIRRDSTTWNIILAIAVEKGEWKRALAITSRMPDLGVSLDGHGFGAAVSAAIALGDWKRALQLLLDWRKAGREVSADTYAGVVQCVCKVGEWERGADLVEELRHHKRRPTVSMYAAIVNAAAEAGQWEAALSYCRQIPEICKGHPPANLYTAVMRAALRWGEYDVVIDLVKEAQDCAKGMVSDEAFRMALHAAGKSRKHASALDLFHSWRNLRRRKSTQPAVQEIWLTALGAIARPGASEEVRELLAEFMNGLDESSSDISTQTALEAISICRPALRDDEFGDLTDGIQKRFSHVKKH